MDKQIQSQVESKLKKDIEELAAFKKDDDRLDELGSEKFADEVESRINAIAEKRRALTDEYRGHKTALNEYLTLKDHADDPSAGEEKKPSPEQVIQNRASSWDEFQSDLGHLPHMETKEKSKAFYSWAARNADQFKGLQHTDDFVEAYDAYDKHISVLRAKHRKQQLEKQDADKRAAEERDKDIPKPNDRHFRPNDRFAKMNKELEDLAAESNKF